MTTNIRTSRIFMGFRGVAVSDEQGTAYMIGRVTDLVKV